MTFTRIVCGVDFSPQSVSAFATAVELAQAVNATLHALHVIEVAVPAGHPLSAGDRTEALSLEQKAAAAMDALVMKWAAPLDAVSVTTEITTGLAGVELLNRVHDPAHDVIVVGARGVSLFEDAFFGSTAAHLVKEASCSVLVVRGPVADSKGK